MRDREPIIRVEGFTAAYAGNVVIDDVGFEVQPGEIVAILGGSGCGKSTLLKHIIGLYEPAAGSIHIEGKDLTAATGDKRREILKRIGVTYQNGALFGSMTLIENIRLPLSEFTELPSAALDLVCRMKLDLVGLNGFGSYLESEISGGMKKRAAIARAMALDPPILCLDEPSAGLDPITSADLDQLILHLARSLGITFVVVTHELASIFTIADRVLMLDKRVKRIVADGKPAELRDHAEDPWIRQFFNREATAAPGSEGEAP